MNGAVFRIMLLGLIRDRGALAMSFLLPAAFFVVFAEIFSGASGDDLRLKVAMSDEVRSDVSRRLLDALQGADALITVGDEPSADEVRRLVRRGSADVGLVVRRGGEPLDSVGGLGPPPLIIVSDPSRAATVPVLTGQVQKAYFEALPDVALSSIVTMIEDQFIYFTDDQRTQLDDGIAELRAQAVGGGGPAWGFQDLVEREDVVGQGANLNQVAYYAGAVAVLFLLFSAVHGAITVLEEEEAGILDRVLAGPGSTAVLINGKFIFLVLQGFVQVGVIFAVAWLGYGVDLPRHLGPWALITLAAAAAASGMALAVACGCRTRRQAQTLANVAILILSARGGSMVPRFLMPPLLQDLGWLTPNTWALEAYTSVFWRDDPARALLVPLAMLITAGAAGLAIARTFARRMQSL